MASDGYETSSEQEAAAVASLGQDSAQSKPADLLPGDEIAELPGSPEQVTVSMQREITAVRPSELDSQVGVVVRLARDSGVGSRRAVHSSLPASLSPGVASARRAGVPE